MYSILDIDLDYFNLMRKPDDQLRRLLRWADCPVAAVVHRHNHAFARWRERWRADGVSPTHILHVDEHHDMMDQRQQANIGNFMLHAMRMWHECRVHWLVQQAIDSPAMWIEDDLWAEIRPRFTHGARRPAKWPKPHLVSICTSPEFVAPDLARELIEVVEEFRPHEHNRRMPNKMPPPCR
ncbi:MAG: hypothetical protein ACLFWL_18685 [Candidatus Brocadiia bacterium]